MNTLPPVLLLGGQVTALAVARSLGRRGVRVQVSAAAGGVAQRSRYCARAFTFRRPAEGAAYWGDLLLGAVASPFAGQVLLPTSDDAIEFVAKNFAALSTRYLLDMRKPGLQLALLDKQRTLELARAAGVATPGFWAVSSAADVERALGQVRFPAIVKPIHSHVFQKTFGCKHFIVQNSDELVRRAREALDAGVAITLCELIPGPDSLLSSYYTYLTPQNQPLFHFTKRVLRRYPLNEGGATYHVTEWLPRTAEAGRKFFSGIGFQGLGNVEFKLDRRDGELKIIECNARFTAAQALVAKSGVDSAWISYCSAAGLHCTPVERWRERQYLWVPEADLRAFRQLRAAGRLSTLGWLRSIARPMSTPFFDRRDPWPAVSGWVQLARRMFSRLGARPAAALSRLAQRAV